MLNNINATIWRVNNLPGTDADFTTLQAAHDYQYVFSGDTLYLEASSGSYGNLNATKSLVIIGTGYFLAENTNSQANINSSKVDVITFSNGSQGSLIQGCMINRIFINTSNIVIKRNYISYYGVQGTITFNENNINNIIIINNYIVNIKNDCIGSCAGQVFYCSKNGINNVLIANNYISTPYKTIDRFTLHLISGFSGIIENNVIYGNIQINNSTFNNNILIDGSFNQSNGYFNNNIGNSTQFGNSNGNQQNVNMNNVFVGTSGNSTDGQWQLKVGSPAIGTGVGGVDCGMFGGDFPYKLSGLPNIPAIYYHQQTIDNVNHLLNITIKAKSHN